MPLFPRATRSPGANSALDSNYTEHMDKNSERLVVYVAVSTFALIGAACFILVIARLPNLETKMPEWIAALGTVSAFAGTILLATSESRRRRRDELNLARLHAAGILQRLVFANQTIKELIRKLERSASIDEFPAQLLGHSDELKKIVVWRVSDAEPLIPLPNNLAAMLAQASDELLTVQSTFFRGNIHGALDRRSDRHDFARSNRDTLIEISEMLDKCIVECQRARELLYNRDTHPS